ncbi:MAG TPA: hypothetical protein ENK72_01750, partial [Epsilonproteobacteria bacterium]|nr:hypothetical protein [Campylobacterota bacterium]
MQIFITLDDEHRLQELIKQQFDMSLPIEGGWGYTQEKATIIQSLDNIPLKQFQHTFASMRAYGEMNMALPEAERYGSINVNELSGETIKIDNLVFEKILYEVSAMKESDYSDFINAYKEGYGKESFNMET